MNKSAREWAKCHIDDHHFKSDIYYARLENRLMNVLTDARRRFTILADPAVRREISFLCAAYLEDTVSGFGIFQTFRNIYESRNGSKWGEGNEDYLDDEVNLEDIGFLISHSLSDTSASDEASAQIIAVSGILFPILIQAWESAPECSEMRAVIGSLISGDNYDDAVSLMIWLFTRCYLTRVVDAERDLENSATEYSRETGLPYRQLLFTLKCNGASECLLSVMKLRPAEFLAALAATYGCERMQNHLESSVYIPTSVFEIVEVSQGSIHARCIQTEEIAPGAEGVVFEISRDSFHLTRDVTPGIYFTGALMRYADCWNLNGMAIFNTENPLESR